MGRYQSHGALGLSKGASKKVALFFFQSCNFRVPPCLSARVSITHYPILNDPWPNSLRISKLHRLDGPLPFRQWALKLVLQGKESYTIRNKTYGLQSGEWLMGNATCEASIRIHSEQPVIGFCLDLHESLVQEVLEQEFSHTPQAWRDQFLYEEKPMLRLNYASGKAGAIVQHMQHQLRIDQQAHLRPETLYQLTRALIEEQIKAEGLQTRVPARKEDTRRHLAEQFHWVLQCMEQQPNDARSIAEWASTAGLSVFHFIRTFKDLTGTSPQHYLLDLRLKLARKLLLEGMSITEVASLSGYSDTSAFGKAFRKFHQHSPGSLKLK